MRPYLITNTLIYALVLIGHIARVVMEGAGTLREPLFAVSTLIVIGLFAWTLRLLRRPPAGS